MKSAFCIAIALALSGIVTTTAQADSPGPIHAFSVTREGAASLPDHTIFHPTDLNAPAFREPIVVWGNGGCRDTNEEFHYFLVHLAAYGYFVVADGKPENPYNPSELTGLVNPQPQKLIAGIDWAIKQNADPSSKYYDRLDPTRVVVMGQSCGGWETSVADGDPRVTTSIIWDSGDDPYDPTAITGLHTPLLYAYGGTTDYANAFPLASYQATTVPTVLASEANAGHTGMWDDPNPPAQPPTDLQKEPLVVAPQWLAFTLYGDPAGKAYFLGASCGLCTRQDWTVQSKNWDGYTRAQTQAPQQDASPAPTPAAAPGSCVRIVRARHHLVRAVVYVAGRRYGVLRGRRGMRVTLSLAVSVRIVGRTRSGRRVVERRRLRGCP